MNRFTFIEPLELGVITSLAPFVSISRAPTVMGALIEIVDPESFVLRVNMVLVPIEVIALVIVIPLSAFKVTSSVIKEVWIVVGEIVVETLSFWPLTITPVPVVMTFRVAGSINRLPKWPLAAVKLTDPVKFSFPPEMSARPPEPCRPPLAKRAPESETVPGSFRKTVPPFPPLFAAEAFKRPEFTIEPDRLVNQMWPPLRLTVLVRMTPPLFIAKA
jgi:hypothetical protein